MKRRMFPPIPSRALAILALVLAGAAALGALMRGCRVPDRTTAARETIVISSSLRLPGGDRIAQYIPIADDPFFPGRTPPATRYQLADSTKRPTTGERSDSSPSDSSPSDSSPSVPTVLGTVVGADGSGFAICTMNGDPPKTVRLGESIGGYRADTIERGRVVFVTPVGQRVTVVSSQERLPRSSRGEPNPVPN